MKIQKITGKIIQKAIDFNRVIERKAIKNNDTSGKITVPKELIDKKLFVVYYEKG